MHQCHQLAGDLVVVFDANFAQSGEIDAIVVNLDQEFVVHDKQFLFLVLGLALPTLFHLPLLLNPADDLLLFLLLPLLVQLPHLAVEFLETYPRVFVLVDHFGQQFLYL